MTLQELMEASLKEAGEIVTDPVADSGKNQKLNEPDQDKDLNKLADAVQFVSDNLDQLGTSKISKRSRVRALMEKLGQSSSEGLLSSNESAASFTKKQAKDLLRKDLQQYFKTPVLSKAQDPVLHQNFANATQVGVKLASLREKVSAIAAKKGSSPRGTEKISHADMKVVLSELPETLRKLKNEKEEMRQKLDKYAAIDHAARIAGKMIEKGMIEETQKDFKTEELLRSGKDLHSIEDAVDLSSPDGTFGKLGSANVDAVNSFESFIMTGQD